MRFLADECCDAALVHVLRAKGHDVLYVVETQSGADDDTILARAFSEHRVLLTEDKDFGLSLGEAGTRHRALAL